MSGYIIRTEGILPTYACLGFVLLFLALIINEVFVSAEAEEAPPTASPLQRPLRPAVAVTIGWCALYYSFLQGQAAAAFWIHKKRREAGNKEKAGHDKDKALEFASVKYPGRPNTQGLIFVMDRSVGNLLEQTPPFLVAVWLHALAASPNEAAFFGWIWLLLRAAYPVAFAHPSMPRALWGVQRSLGVSWVSLITWPSYAVIWRLLYGAARGRSV